MGHINYISYGSVPVSIGRGIWRLELEDYPCHPGHVENIDNAIAIGVSVKDRDHDMVTGPDGRYLNSPHTAQDTLGDVNITLVIQRADNMEVQSRQEAGTGDRASTQGLDNSPVSRCKLLGSGVGGRNRYDRATNYAVGDADQLENRRVEQDIILGCIKVGYLGDFNCCRKGGILQYGSRCVDANGDSGLFRPVVGRAVVVLAGLGYFMVNVGAQRYLIIEAAERYRGSEGVEGEEYYLRHAGQYRHPYLGSGYHRAIHATGHIEPGRYYGVAVIAHKGTHGIGTAFFHPLFSLQDDFQVG